MEIVEVELTTMAHGGAALGRDANNRVIFVPGGIPGERVEVELREAKARFGRARLRQVITPSPDRIEAAYPADGPHGGLAFQHISYDAQLRFKREVVIDQMKRIGRLDVSDLTRLTIPSPLQWQYAYDVVLSSTPEGGFGFWNGEAVVPPGEQLPTLVPPLAQLVHDFDFELPELRSMTLRAGSDDTLLVALEIEDIEAPQLEADFPVSVALVLPDGTAANLLGYNTIYREVEGQPLRISAGSAFYDNLSMIPALRRIVTAYVGQADGVIELYAGVGTLTAALAPISESVHAVERSADAVEDAAVNLEETDNVALYQGWVEDVLPMIEVRPEVVVLDPPPSGAGAEVLAAVAAVNPQRIVYSGGDVATLARDARELTAAGYRLTSVTPLDMLPQTFHVHVVTHWVAI